MEIELGDTSQSLPSSPMVCVQTLHPGHHDRPSSPIHESSIQHPASFSMATGTYTQRGQSNYPSRCAHSASKTAQSHRDSSAGISRQQSASDISDAKFLISRVQSSCQGKAAYMTRAEVTTYLRQSGYKGFPFTCQFCGLWHVTSMTKKQQKALTQKIRTAKKLLDQSITPSLHEQPH